MPTDPATSLDALLAARVRAAQRGEEVAFSELVRESYAAVLHHALRLLRDPAEAQDCTQEAFAEAFTALGSLAEPLAWRSWLRSIVRHRCLRRLRRRDLELLALVPEIEALVPDLAGAERRQFLEQWAHAGRLIDALPNAEREVTLLFYVKQCSQHEIGSFLALPLSTVNNRLHQARERLERFGEIMTTVTPRDPAADRVSRIGTMQRFWVLAHAPAEPAYEGLRDADALIYHSPILAFQQLYPAVDAEHSWSKQLTPEIAGAEHVELARRAREALLLAKRAFTDPIGLELIACRAFPAATRQFAAFAQRVLQGAATQLVRARKLQLFLTQPFGTDHTTGWGGVTVSLHDTLDGVRAILDGEADDLPLEAFPYRGNLDDVRAHAGEPRHYGRRS